MPRIPSYNKKAPKTVTPAMLWDADEKAETARKEEEERQKRIIFTRNAEAEREAKERQRQAEVIRQRKAIRSRYACSFCGSPDRDHECLEYKRMLGEYSAKPHPIRAGVTWEWAKEFYGKQGKEPPMPREAYD